MQLKTRHRAYIFQNKDNRIIFAIPYLGDFTLLSTTDQDYKGDPAKVEISQAEIDYILSAAGEYFQQAIKADSIVWELSGVRPLYDDGASKAQEATRDYVLKQIDIDNLPLLNCYGGKITTYRRLAEDAMKIIEKKLGTRKPAWTANVCLPGGNFSHLNKRGLIKTISDFFPNLTNFTHKRLAHIYGTEALKIISPNIEENGIDFGYELFETEIQFLIRNEWTQTAEDILWRRTKLGLSFSQEQTEKLQMYMQKQH